MFCWWRCVACPARLCQAVHANTPWRQDAWCVLGCGVVLRATTQDADPGGPELQHLDDRYVERGGHGRLPQRAARGHGRVPRLVAAAAAMQPYSNILAGAGAPLATEVFSCSICSYIARARAPSTASQRMRQCIRALRKLKLRRYSRLTAAYTVQALCALLLAVHYMHDALDLIFFSIDSPGRALRSASAPRRSWMRGHALSWPTRPASYGSDARGSF